MSSVSCRFIIMAFSPVTVYYKQEHPELLLLRWMPGCGKKLDIHKSFNIILM